MRYTNQSGLKHYDEALEFYENIIKKQANAKFILLEEFKGDETLAIEELQKTPKKRWIHFVVTVNDIVYDRRPNRFGYAQSNIYSTEKLTENWVKQTILKEVSL